MRGQNADVGATRVSQNGYHYTKVEDRGDGKPGWRLTHHLIAEKRLGRKIREDERVSFVNGKKSDLRPDNVKVSEKGTGSVRRRLAQLEARRDELTAEIDALRAEIEGGRLVHR